MGFTTIVLTFFLYGFTGWLLEVVYMLCEQRRFINRGFLAGPICPMYGVGMALMSVLLAPLRENSVLLFLSVVLLTTGLEFFVGWLLELVFKTRWWDYSDRRFNLMGHVCLEFSLAWGVGAFLALKYVHPYAERLIASLPHTGHMALSSILLAVLAADTAVSVTSALRLKNSMEKLQAMLTASVPAALAEELRRRRESLGEAAERMNGLVTRMQRRLLMAYPHAQSKRFADALNSVKKALRRR